MQILDDDDGDDDLINEEEDIEMQTAIFQSMAGDNVTK